MQELLHGTLIPKNWNNFCKYEILDIDSYKNELQPKHTKLHVPLRYIEEVVNRLILQKYLHNQRVPHQPLNPKQNRESPQELPHKRTSLSAILILKNHERNLVHDWWGSLALFKVRRTLKWLFYFKQRDWRFLPRLVPPGDMHSQGDDPHFMKFELANQLTPWSWYWVCSWCLVKLSLWNMPMW